MAKVTGFEAVFCSAYDGWDELEVLFIIYYKPKLTDLFPPEVRQKAEYLHINFNTKVLEVGDANGIIYRATLTVGMMDGHCPVNSAEGRAQLAIDLKVQITNLGWAEVFSSIEDEVLVDVAIHFWPLDLDKNSIEQFYHDCVDWNTK